MIVLIAAITVIVVLLGVVVVFFMMRNGNQTNNPPTVPAHVETWNHNTTTDGGATTVTPSPMPTPVTTPSPTPTPELQRLSGAEIFARNRDAVIIIRLDLGGGRYGTASGFIVCSTGIAVTNHHVMDGALNAVAIFYDGSEFNITGYYSYDFANDLAVIQLDGAGVVFDFVALGDSDLVNVGDNVYAIGGPDWDPITFTPGMISRIAYEPINFDIYTVAGMFQNTAAIYGGNSGGPLVNEYGQVIGVNAAGNMVRSSVQWAVPVNRVVLPETGSRLNPLPLGGASVFVPAATPVPGQLSFYARFPLIPDFLSVSRNASLSFSSTPGNLGLGPGDIIYDYYDYLFMYTIPTHAWIWDTEDYDDVLQAQGFIFQNVIWHGSETWVYLYHPVHNISVSYAFDWDTETLLLAIVAGDVYTRFYYGGVGTPEVQQPWEGNHVLIGRWEWDYCTYVSHGGSSDPFNGWFMGGEILEFYADGYGLERYGASGWEFIWYDFSIQQGPHDSNILVIIHLDDGMELAYGYAVYGDELYLWSEYGPDGPDFIVFVRIP
jgi:hypothetical protein